MKKILFLLLISLIPNFLIAQALTCDIKASGISYSTYDLCVGDYVILDGTPSGGTTPYTHSWTGGGGQLSIPPTAQSNTFTAVTPGTYTVVYQVIDAVPDTVTDTIIITVNPLPDLSTTNNQIICLGNCVNLTAWTSAGDGLIWYEGYIGGPVLGSSFVSPLTVNVCPTADTTYYALAYIASTGCTKSKKVTVYVIDLIATASASPDTICIGDTSCLTSSSSGGIGPTYTYQWSPCIFISNCFIANPCVWPPSTTTYCVTVTDSASGCSASACVTVTVNPQQLPIITGDPIVCNGLCDTLIATGPSCGWLWSTGETNDTIIVCPAITTIYTVTMTDCTGCTASASFAVTVNPVVNANAGPDLFICFGACDTIGGIPTASGGTPPYTYNWSPPGGLSCTNCPNPIACPTVTTTYCVTVTDAVGCSASDCMTMTVNPQLIVDAGNDTIVCDSGCITIGGNPTASGGTPPYTYNWLPATGLNYDTIPNPIACFTTTTTYCVTVTDASGCTASDCVTITVNSATATITPASDTICQGDSVQLCASAGISWIWNPGGDTTQCIWVNPIITTTYCVTVTDANGCTASACATVTVNAATASITPASPVICPGDTITLCASAGISWIWSPGNETTQCITVFPAATTTYCVTVTLANGCTASACATVTVLLATATITPASPTICLGDSVQLCASAGNSWIWNPGGDTTQCIWVSPAITTIYCVTVTAGNGCTATACATVTVNPNPTAEAGPDSTICSGTCIQIGGTPTASGGTPPYTYSWSPVTGLSDPTIANPIACPTITTIYCVTVTDTLGCTASDCVTITVNPQLIVDAGNDTIVCDSGCITIGGNPTASGGTPPYTYSWSPVTGLSDPTIANPIACFTTTTTYCVTVTDTLGCTASDCVTITVNTATASITPSFPTICQGDSVQLCASAGISWIWNPGGDTTQCIWVSPAITTTYCVTVTAGNGCTATACATVTVNPNPTAEAGPDSTICNGTCIQIGGTPTASGGTPPYTYQWSSIPPLFSSNQANPTICPVDTTTYIVLVTDSVGCTDMDSVIINVLPFILPVIIASDTGFCDSAYVNATLCAGAGYTSYLWSPSGQITQCITVTQPGCYNVMVTDANGCTAVSPDVCIQIYTLSDSIMANGPTQFCQLDSVLLYLNNPYYTYEWSSGSINIPTIQVYETGDYYVTVTDSFGCVVYAGPKQIIVDPLPQAIISYVDKDNALLTFDFYSFSLYATSYYWDFGDTASPNNTSNSEDPSHNYSTTGTFTVMLVAYSDSCGNDTAYATVFVHLPTSGLTGYSDTFNFILYPNPTKDVINLDFITSTSEQISLTLFDVLGRQLYSDAMSYYSGKYHKEINIESLPRGMYVLRITADENTYMNRIIKD